MSFLCTVINREVDYDSCKNGCQYIYKSPCIDKINEGYNQALEDFAKVLCDELDKGYIFMNKHQIIHFAEQLKRQK